MTDTTTDHYADVLDEEWLAAPRRRSRLRSVLTGLLAASLVFLAGVEVQRELGADSSTSSAAAGGFPDLAGGGGQLPPGLPAAGGGQDTQPDSSGAGDEEAAVIGTVESVKGQVWTIRDLGGTVHDVTVSDSVRIVRESDVDPAEVAPGATVDIAGTTGESGDVTATTITVR